MNVCMCQFSQLQKLTVVEDLRSLLMEDGSDLIYDSGFSVPISRVSLKDVPTIIEAVCLHTTIFPVKAALDQLVEGLQLFNVISLIKSHPDKIKSLFVHDPRYSQLTVDQMVALFEVVYSLQGSSKRVKEEATFMHYNEFLNDVANGAVGWYN